MAGSPALVLVLALGCGAHDSGGTSGEHTGTSADPVETSNGGSSGGEDSSGAGELGGELAALDAKVVARFPSATAATIQASIPIDETGLLGRNREWGGLYSVRFQVGAGLATRVSLAAGDLESASRAFLALEVGSSAVKDDGSIPSSFPDQPPFSGAQPGPTDIASAAAFFLGDACLALHALARSPRADDVASATRRQTVTDRLSRAVAWLNSQDSLLLAGDQYAPNRLFHDALAFQACGALGGDTTALALAAEFAERALAQFDPSGGFYVEGGGSDTNYQAVNVRVAVDLLLAGLVARRAEIEAQLAPATGWCVERTTADGRVDSSGNTRSCGGCEVFLPGDPPKQLGLPEWFRALAWGGGLLDDGEAWSAADRFVEWVSSNPTVSCFVQDGNGQLQALDPQTACP